MKQYPSQEKLRELFDYDPEGFLVWREGPRAGKVAGSFGVNKELRVFYDVRINGKLFSGAKLIWVWHKSILPKYIFHKDSNQASNKIENLISSNLRKGFNSGFWKKNLGAIRFVEKEKNIKLWFNTVGNRRGFYTPEAAGQFADLEIERLGLNYQKNNLNLKNFEEESAHGKRQVKNYKINATSKFIGVSKNKNKWVAKCARKYLGFFNEQQDAARAYNVAAKERYGEHAVLNDIPNPLGQGDIF